MKLVDSEGREVGVGEPGEIWTRGANVTPGYWRRPELNATAFQDGWFKTGDVAVQDTDGFYSIVDRIKDMFISGGENVYPAEIEATIVELDSLIMGPLATLLQARDLDTYVPGLSRLISAR